MGLFQNTFFKERSNTAVAKALRVTINFYKKIESYSQDKT